MDNLKRAAQGTLPEQEVLDVASQLCLDRWEDDGGLEAPTNAALAINQRQAPSGPTPRPQESTALACLAGDSANARDTHAGGGASQARNAQRRTSMSRAQKVGIER